jgi:catechol 2,3-dioxygenase-like lactoylglutathione lyase family enzyme
MSSTPAPTGIGLGPLGQVSLSCRDAGATEAWYRDVLGLPEVFRFGDLVFFDCGGVRLYLHAVGDEKWRAGSILYFLVPDIEAAHAELVARGIKVTGAPHLVFRDDATGTEEWMAFFEDPDANLLALMARVPAAP